MRTSYKLGDLIMSVSETYLFDKEQKEVVFLNTSDILNGKVLRHLYSQVQDLPGQAKKCIRNGDILFSEIRPINRRFAFIDFKAEDYVVSTKLMVLRCKDRIVPKYLLYFLTTDESLIYLQLLAEARSGTFPQITYDQIKEMEIIIPPVDEQEKIVSILSSLDDKIDLLHRQNLTLEALTETLFRQWFVENIGQNVKTEKIEMHVEIASGKSLKQEEYDDSGEYAVWGANGVIGRTHKYLTEDMLIMTGRVGTLGNIFINDKERIWISDNVLVIKLKDVKYFYYIYFLLKSIEFENLNRGSTQPLITQTDLKNIEFKVPDCLTLNVFDELARVAFNKINRNKTQIRTLETLRDTLLPKLMSGEVRVNYDKDEAEKVI